MEEVITKPKRKAIPVQWVWKCFFSNYLV